MKIICSLDDSVNQRPHLWSQLLELTRTAWSGEDGKCYFPYAPLTTLEYWETVISTQWSAQEVISWMAVDEDGKIVAHAALVKKDGYYELGRWVSYKDNPKGTMTDLCRIALSHATGNQWKVLVESTQAHTTSQYICTSLGLRFAGIGFLDKIEGVNWDIVYYDNCALPSFSPQVGSLSNHLGVIHPCDQICRPRLEQVLSTLSTDRGGQFPPNKFCVLPSILRDVKTICEINLGASD